MVDLIGVGEVVGGDDFALHYGDVDLGLVFVFDTHQPGPTRRSGGVAAAAGRDAGLRISADHELVWPQQPTVEHPGGQVQHRRRLGCEVGVTRKIYDRNRHGRMASPRRIRLTVDGEMDSTTLRVTSSKASSAKLHLDNDTLVVGVALPRCRGLVGPVAM